jgi:hypothetical protein
MSDQRLGAVSLDPFSNSSFRKQAHHIVTPTREKPRLQNNISYISKLEKQLKGTTKKFCTCTGWKQALIAPS